jgi:alkylhydroperoxidase family enzyme
LVPKGFTEAEVAAEVGALDAASARRLPPKTIAALRLVDRLTVDHPVIDDESHRELTADFDAGEILELSAAVVIASGWQRLNPA